MKKNILYSLLMGAALTGFASCMEIDNFDEPDAHFSGTIIDATTGKPILADQGECHVRIWEYSYSVNPSPQNIPVKKDGTFNNTKLFKGTYGVLPEGAWWPPTNSAGEPDTLRVGIGGNTVQDFKVTPYLKLVDFKADLKQCPESAMDTLTLSCRIEVPIEEDLPQILDIRPMLSLNQFCGAANHIDYYWTNSYMTSIRKRWEQLKDAGKDMDYYTFRLPVKRGYHYFARMGARVGDNFQNYNYTEIVEVEVPQQ